MENKKCPNCIKRENPKTKLYEFVCKKDGYRKCNSLTCPYENEENEYSLHSYNFCSDY